MVASPKTKGKTTETHVEVIERCTLALPGHPSECVVFGTSMLFSPSKTISFKVTELLHLLIILLTINVLSLSPIYMSAVGEGQPVALVRLKPITGKNIEE